MQQVFGDFGETLYQIHGNQWPPTHPTMQQIQQIRLYHKAHVRPLSPQRMYCSKLLMVWQLMSAGLSQKAERSEGKDDSESEPSCLHKGRSQTEIEMVDQPDR